jgi:hypothetical protein
VSTRVTAVIVSAARRNSLVAIVVRGLLHRALEQYDGPGHEIAPLKGKTNRLPTLRAEPVEAVRTQVGTRFLDLARLL